MIRKVLLVLAAAGATALVVPSLASAEVYLTKAQAEADTEHAVTARYSSQYPDRPAVPRASAARRPATPTTAGCAYGPTSTAAEGTLLITGSRGRGYFYHRVLSGQRCP